MTQTVSQPQIPAFLSQTPPFDRLAEDRLRSLSSKCQLLRYRIGQRMLDRDKMPDRVLVIYQGQARILGYDHRSQKSVSLEIAGPGRVLGRTDLVRGIPCETAIASTETICLSVPEADFRACMEGDRNFDIAVRERTSPSEIFEVLSLELQRRADASSNAKELAFQLWNEAIVLDLPPGKFDRESLDGNRMWLIGSGKVGNRPAGSRLFPSQAPTELTERVRLLGLPQIQVSRPGREDPATTAMAAPSPRWTR